MVPVIHFQPTHKIHRLSADHAALQVEIRAHRAGLIAALLRLMGIGTEARLAMDADGFRLDTTGFAGQTRTYCVLANIAAAVSVVAKRLELLILGCLLGFWGVGALLGGVATGETVAILLALVMLALAALCFLFFARSRNVIVGIVTSAGTAESLKLQADARQIRQLHEQMRIVEALLNGGKPPRSTADGLPDLESADDRDSFEDDEEEDEEPEFARTKRSAPIAAAPVLAHPPETTVTTCPHCGIRLKIGPHTRAKTVRCPSCGESFQPR